MPSERVFRIATAALLHDLPALAGELEQPPAVLARLLELAEPAEPADLLLVQQAERYARQHAGQRDGLSSLPLRAVFARGEAQPALCYPLAALPSIDQPGDGLFPGAAPTLRARAAYLIEMFEALGQLAARADLSRADVAYAHLQAWLARYGRCLPAHDADQPLADHARLCAAAAACLALYHTGPRQATPIRASEAAPRFLLIAGALVAGRPAPLARDTPNPAEASARVRGQALAHELLRDLIGQIICERLGVPFGNLLMRLDGAFYLLAPNTPGAGEALAELEREIGGWLHADSTGSLALALASAELSGAQLHASAGAGPGFGAVLSALQQSLARQRAQPGLQVLSPAGAWDERAFQFRELRYEQGACAHCGWLPAGQAGSCPACARAIALGQQIAQARAIAYYSGGAPAGALAGPCGWSFMLLAEPGAAGQPAPQLVEQINDPDLSELGGLPASFRYLAYHTPPDLDASAPDLPALAVQSSGRALLGYLRVAIEQPVRAPLAGPAGQPLPPDSAAQIMARARELELFMGAWVRRLLGRPEHQQSLTLLAGDSQLLLAGPWDHTPVQALEIRAQLGRFTAHSPAVALSAGVLLCQPHYPLSAAMAETSELLERSQAATWRDEHGRARSGDQLTLLGSTLHWADTPAVLDEIKKLHRRAQMLPSALLNDLAEYGRSSAMAEQREQAGAGLRYKAMFAFNLARTLRRSDSELYRWADRLIQSLSGADDDPTIRHIGLIATYLLLLRPAE